MRKGLDSLPHLRALGQQVNRKLLEVERLSQHCTFSPWPAKLDSTVTELPIEDV